MPNAKGNILIVDDDTTILDTETLLLESEGHTVVRAAYGQDALNKLAKMEPRADLIISDVLMPEMDGYELCREVRQDRRTQDTPFLFVSAVTTAEEKLKCFEAGGDDFILKVDLLRDVAAKASHLIDIALNRRSLEQRVRDSQRAAFQAMTYSSDLGRIVAFYQDTANAAIVEDVALRALQVTTEWELDCVLRVRKNTTYLLFKNGGNVAPLEANVLELTANKGRFFDFGGRTVVNHAHFSLLVKNMPTSNPERYGLLKDTLGTLGHAIDSRLEFVLTRDAISQKDAVLQALQSAMTRIRMLFQDIQHANVSATDQLKNELDDALLRLGLLEYQEQDIQDIADRCQLQIAESAQRGAELNTHFDDLINLLMKKTTAQATIA